MILSESVRAVVERLPAGWQIMSFGEVLAEPVRNGIYKSKEFHGRGARVVNMGELFGHDFISDQEMKRVELTDDEKSKSSLKDGDLLFARRSLVFEGSGKCSIVVNPPELTTFESSIIRARPNRGIAEPRFLFYLFASPVGRAIVASIATRTAVSGIRGSDLWQVGLPLPPLPAQRRIAGVLSDYDELIENNQRRIQILETMARALYREWFVEFRFPGHDKIPRVASPLGDIPQGWEIVAFTEIVDVLGGGTPKTAVAEYWNGEIPFFTPRDAPACFYVQDTDKHITRLGLSKCASELYAPDTVFITARGTVGKVALPSVSMAMNQSCYALRGKAGIPQRFLFLLTLQQVDYLQTNTGGATFGTIVVDTFRQMKVVKPAHEVIASFARQIDAIFEHVDTIQRQMQNLRRTRDLLLPRLLSGQVALTETAA